MARNHADGAEFSECADGGYPAGRSPVYSGRQAGTHAGNRQCTGAGVGQTNPVGKSRGTLAGEPDLLVGDNCRARRRAVVQASSKAGHIPVRFIQARNHRPTTGTQVTPPEQSLQRQAPTPHSTCSKRGAAHPSQQSSRHRQRWATATTACRSSSSDPRRPARR
jgi:hypothetical protein